jgi:hypothetical protein
MQCSVVNTGNSKVKKEQFIALDLCFSASQKCACSASRYDL